MSNKGFLVLFKLCVLCTIKNVFREYTKFCCKLGLIKGDLIAIDGSKFLTVNSKERCFTIDSVKDKIEKLNTSVTEYMNEMDINDFEEKNESEYTKKDLQERIERLEQKKTIYERYLRQMEQTGETQIALTDPESRIMKTRHGKNACLNVQTAVDAENHLITNFVVTNQCNDFGLLASTISETKELLGAESIETIADKGYRSDEDVLKCLLNGDIPNVYPRDGKDCYDNVLIFENTHEAIVDRKTFDLVQKHFVGRKRPDKHGEMDKYAGYLYCGDCGRRLYLHRNKQKKRIVLCAQAIKIV